MTTPSPLSRAAVQRLTLASDPWLSCDDCFDQVDEMIEQTLTGTGTMSAAFRVHLRACAVCRHEAYSLATLVAPDHGVAPASVSAELDGILGIVR